MCLLTISVKNTRPEAVKLAKIAQNSGFPRFELVRARTFERKVLETWLQAQMKGLGPYMCLLTILVKKHPTESCEIGKNSGFHRKYILNLQKTHTPSSLGAVGACSCFTNTSLFKDNFQEIQTAVKILVCPSIFIYQSAT